MASGSQSRARAGVAESPFKEDIEKQIRKMKKILARIPNSTRTQFPVTMDTMKIQGVMYSWITKGGIQLPPVNQQGDTCWAWGLYRSHTYFTTINGVQGYAPSTFEGIFNGVARKHLTNTNGIDDIANARDYMIKNNHVKDMIVHRRPLQNYKDEGFEILIEKLLIRGPLLVSFDCFPSYNNSYRGEGVYVPQVRECQTTHFEIYAKHLVVIVGIGAKKFNGETKEFWLIHDSKGEAWGIVGFDCLSRRMGLITEAVEFQF